MSNHDKKDPGLQRIERAKLACEAAKKRLSSTSGSLQYRLKPGNLASDAWNGVKDKSGELADDALQVVKDRPVTAGGIAAALILFVARDPLWAVVSRLFNKGGEDELLTAKLDTPDENYDLAAPAVSRSVKEGAHA